MKGQKLLVFYKPTTCDPISVQLDK